MGPPRSRGGLGGIVPPGQHSAEHELGRAAADVRDEEGPAVGPAASSAVAPVNDSIASSAPVRTSGATPSTSLTRRTNSAALSASLVALVATIRTACAPELAMMSA